MGRIFKWLEKYQFLIPQTRFSTLRFYKEFTLQTQKLITQKKKSSIVSFINKNLQRDSCKLF